MGTCPDPIKRLIDRFEHQSDQLRSADYSEALIRIQFINPMFEELGWDIDNRQGFAMQYAEVVHEDRVRVAGQTKAPDYSFRVGGQRKFFLEAKKPAVDIRNNWEPAYQLRRYAWSAKLAVSLLTDFEELAVYDTRIQPKQLEKPATARRELIKYTDYPARWDFLDGTFSKRAVYAGDFDRYCESKKGRGAQAFDDAFLEEIEEWRSDLASNLALRNDALDAAGLNFAVQRIIDRIIFLRIAEDRGTETIGQLQQLMNGDAVFARLNELFRRADERYNSGLFHFHPEKDRDEAPDTLTPTLDVDDKTLKDIIKRLYYPQSPYEFTMVSADILGSIYERFLGKVITLTAGHRARIEEKPEVRKAGGVYYTPTYIVDYIVKNTVGKLLESRGTGFQPVSAEKHGLKTHATPKLRILDPACGSGSFLIGAYGFLLNWYLDQYRAQGPAALATGKNPVLRPTALGDWALTINARKRILLDHMHGVDIDAQAVEVTKLNLLLKCLEGETSQTLGFEQRLFRERALPDLGKNIQCGNSLIGTDIIGTPAWNAMSEAERRRINPFDYDRAFPQVFKGKDGGGFDAVLGNPPYLFITEVPPIQRRYFENKFHGVDFRFDLYGSFCEEAATRWLRDGGVFGVIIPHSLLSNDSYIGLRALLGSRTRITEVFDIGSGVFVGARNETMLLFFVRGTADGTVTVKAGKAKRFPVPDREFNVTQGSWADATGSAWRVSGGENTDRVVKRFNGLDTLDKFCVPNQGLRTGNNAKYIAAAPAGAKWKPGIGGKDVDRYGDTRPAFFVYYDPRVLDRPRTPEIFLSPEKIVIQEIRNISLPRRLVATLDCKKLFCIQSTNVVNMRPGATVNIRFILGILNSAAANYYFRCAFPGNNHIPTNQLAKIPIPKASNAEHDHLTSLVTTMLTLHQTLAAEKNPQHRSQVEREIAATDRRIDALVYQLYGLTDEEVAVVEAATA